jgi:hypothetical protein
LSQADAAVPDSRHDGAPWLALQWISKTRPQHGRLAIVDFRKGAPSGPPEEFRFTPAQISAELAEAGFSLETTHDQDTYPERARSVRHPESGHNLRRSACAAYGDDRAGL